MKICSGYFINACWERGHDQRRQVATREEEGQKREQQVVTMPTLGGGGGQGRGGLHLGVESLYPQLYITILCQSCTMQNVHNNDISCSIRHFSLPEFVKSPCYAQEPLLELVLS